MRDTASLGSCRFYKLRLTCVKTNEIELFIVVGGCRVCVKGDVCLRNCGGLRRDFKHDKLFPLVLENTMSGKF